VRRKRQQAGYIFKARGHWYVRYFEDRMVDGKLRHDRVAKQIGEVTTRGKRPPRKIEDEAQEIVAAATVTNANPERVLTISEFIDRVYFPHVEQYKRPSTLRGYKDIWKNHVKARCSGVWLKDVRTFHVQSWLNAIASPGTLGRNSLKHIKTFLSGLFKLAKQQGYYSGENPVRDTATSPKAPPPRETYAYDLAEIQQMISVMPEPAATIFAVAAFTGLRRGELQGLRWEDYQDGQIRVSRAIWEGHISDPKTGRSKGAVPVIKQVADRLEFHRLRNGNVQEGPMFPNGKKPLPNNSKQPLCLNNVLGRQILPALKRCEHCGKAEGAHAEAKHDFKLDEKFPKWRGWHAARRGLGTNLYALGVSEKVIQQILRHANVSTTATYYIKTVPTQVTDAMERLQQALPEILSGNKVATDTWNATAAPAVN
jgi:integrase